MLNMYLIACYFIFRSKICTNEETGENYAKNGEKRAKIRSLYDDHPNVQ